MINTEGNFVIIKLVSGEQIMATLTNEDDAMIQIDYPMLIRLVPFMQGGKTHEHVTASPLCQFSEDKHFSIPKSTVIFVKKLHQMIVPHYTRLVDEHEASVLVRKEEDGSVSQISLKPVEEEEEPITVEEIRRRIDMLEAIANAPTVRTEEEEEGYRYYIEGNDTLN